MALQKSRTRINVKGGGTLKIRELSPSASDTFLDVGYVTSDTLLDEHTMVDSVDDAGNFIDTKSGAQKVTWKAVLKQTSIDEINLLKNAVGKYYDLFYSVVLANGNTQEFRVWLGKIKPGLVLEFASATERKLELEITALMPKATFTATPTDYNVTAGAYYVVIDNAVAKGTPSDTAATMATAIL
jgi:hypothetical protein